jgi:hypothetical protein
MPQLFLSRIHLEKLLVASLVNKFGIFYGLRRSVTFLLKQLNIKPCFVPEAFITHIYIISFEVWF